MLVLTFAVFDLSIILDGFITPLHNLLFYGQAIDGCGHVIPSANQNAALYTEPQKKRRIFRKLKFLNILTKFIDSFWLRYFTFKSCYNRI